MLSIFIFVMMTVFAVEVAVAAAELLLQQLQNTVSPFGSLLGLPGKAPLDRRKDRLLSSFTC